MSRLRIAIDALPAFPMKSGAVGAFRNMMQIAPKLDEELEIFMLVSPSEKAYYSPFLDPQFADRVKFQVFRYPEQSLTCRLAVQHLLVPRACQKLGISVHFSLNPEPAFGMHGIYEVFKVADLQWLDVPAEFGVLKPLYRLHMGRRKARRSHLIIANSQYTKTRVMKCFGVEPNRIAVVHEAVDHTLFHFDSEPEQHKRKLAQKYGITLPYILYVSGFRPYKNPLALVRAYESLLSHRFDLPHHLVMIGNDLRGYRSVVEAEVKNRGLSARVHFLDFVHHGDLPSFYHAAAVFVYSSELETFGIPPLEAMACGTPVIASCYTAIPEISGEGACIIDPKNTEEMARALLRVLDDGTYSKELTQRGLKWCKQFTWECNVSETLSHVKFLMRQGAR